MGARFPFIDNLKAIAIVLVVAGHAPAMPRAVQVLIFGCHVPLFFFAAGFLAAAAQARTATDAARAVLRRFVRPYAGFFLLSWTLWLLTRHAGNSAQRYAQLAWWDPWVDFVLGYGSYVNPTLWFFPCIAATVLLHRALRGRLGGLALLVTCLLPAAALALWLPAAGPVLPWRLDTATVALAFFGLGHFCHARALARLVRRPPGGWLPWALLAGVGYAWLALRNPGVDLARMRFGIDPALYLPVACLGIAALGFGALSFAGNAVTRWLAANTLYIFPLHWLMFRVFTGAGVVLFDLPRDFKDRSWLIGVTYALLALLLCVPAAALLRRGPAPTGGTGRGAGGPVSAAAPEPGASSRGKEA
jgi:acyltransferase